MFASERKLGQGNLQMKVSVQQIERMTGLSRTKIYKDIKNGLISTETSEKGTRVIDISEVSRVYQIVNPDPLEKVQASANQHNNIVNNKKESGAPLSDANYRDKYETSQSERERERDLYERHIEDLKGALAKAQDVTLLLENNSKQNESGAGDWQKAIADMQLQSANDKKALENRIANEEKSRKEDKERSEKILRQNRALKAALDAEKKKSFFQKLFG